MNRPYNSAAKQVVFFGNAGKLALLFLVTTIAAVGISCRNATSVVEERAAVRPAAEAIAEAEQFYAGRADLVKVRQGLVVLRQAQAPDQGNYEFAWRLAKFNYYLGAHTPDSAERDKAFHDGIEAGKLAVKLQDGKPDGHFWLGANYGGSAKASMLSGLTEFDDIKREMETVLKLDEGYQSGSAYMVLGQLYLEAPRFLGGDTQKAIQNLEKGLRFGPDNALLRARLAEAYAEANRNEDARKQIDALLVMKAAPGFEPEHDEALAEVKKLQEKLK
jgi:tetratricopeptide (TPR) repeat protein